MDCTELVALHAMPQLFQISANKCSVPGEISSGVHRALYQASYKMNTPPHAVSLMWTIEVKQSVAPEKQHKLQVIETQLLALFILQRFKCLTNNHSLLNSWRPNELLTSSWWVIWTSVWSQVSGVGLCMVHVRVFPTRNMAWPDRSLLHGLAFSNWCSDKQASPSWSLSTKQGLHECSKNFLVQWQIIRWLTEARKYI